jgi:hypothetical protein
VGFCQSTRTQFLNFQIQSPDIIPEGKANLTEDDLINSYNRWIGAEVTPGEKNKIYVRALAARPSGQPSAALVNLTAVPSELILWPQVWKKGENLEPNSIVINSRGEGKGNVAHFSYQGLLYSSIE